jgi:hypothetical protein
MRIDTLTAEHRQAYDELLLARDDTLLYQSSRYMSLLEELLGCRQATLLASDNDGMLLAALPLMEADGPFGVAVNSLPFYGSNGGLIGADPAARQALVDAYNARVTRDDVATATVVENPLDPDRVTGWRHELNDERIGQFTPIDYVENHGDLLMASFHYKTRNAIRKAWKSGAMVAVENNAMDFLVEVHELNMREIGGVPKSRRFFNLIPAHFRADVDYRIYVTRLHGEAVAAVLVFYFNQVVEYFTPVVRKEFRESQALSAAIYQAMCEASKAGFRWWNWGGTWLSQDGVYRFKSRWGTQNIRYQYYTTVQNRAVLQAQRFELLSEYPWFYVVPFASLKEQSLV